MMQPLGPRRLPLLPTQRPVVPSPALATTSTDACSLTCLTEKTAAVPQPAATRRPDRTVTAFCIAAWPVLGVRGRDNHVYGEQMDLRASVLGEPRLNRPYPDPALLAAGLPQSLPLDVHTPFKWLLTPPQPLGDAVLLHAQHEGGPGFCGDEELECRDLFIVVRENPQTRRFDEVAHLQTKPSEYAYVYRSTDAPDIIGDRHFLVRLEEGTYSSGIFARHSHLYTLQDNELREVATWQGHLDPSHPDVQRAAR